MNLDNFLISQLDSLKEQVKSKGGNEMRTPNELRLDYVKNSGNWLKWIKGVQYEAWDAALDRMRIEVDSSSLPVQTKELVIQMTGILKKIQ
jgi:hypothetical protein